MSWRLYLDDVRTPPAHLADCRVARSALDARLLIATLGMPSFISFDHDLGYPPAWTGFDFAKWLVECDLDRQIMFPKGFTWAVHSANPVGAANINGLLANYFENRDMVE